MKETTVQEFRRRSQTKSVIISLHGLALAKKQGRKVRRASPFGLTFEEAGYIYSIDGYYFRCDVDPDLVKIALKGVRVGDEDYVMLEAEEVSASDKSLKKEERFPKLFCEECLKDLEVECKRDSDVQCLYCGKKLCGYHMVRHLEKEHLVSLTWKGM